MPVSGGCLCNVSNCNQISERQYFPRKKYRDKTFEYLIVQDGFTASEAVLNKSTCYESANFFFVIVRTDTEFYLKVFSKVFRVIKSDLKSDFVDKQLALF